MGKKTSIIPQMDFLLPTKFKKHHRPSKLTGKNNIAAYDALIVRGDIGLTANELAAELLILEGTAGSCLNELRWLGLARRTEAQRAGKTVWVRRIRLLGTEEPSRCDEEGRYPSPHRRNTGDAG